MLLGVSPCSFPGRSATTNVSTSTMARRLPQRLAGPPLPRSGTDRLHDPPVVRSAICGVARGASSLTPETRTGTRQ